MYYSPGVKYFCPSCNSDFVRFVFYLNCKEWSESIKLIRAKKVVLSNSYEDCIENPLVPKWICKKCYDCGVVLKSRLNKK